MKIGALGGGQLGRMLALAGLPLGFHFRFLDPSPDACAGEVGELLTADYGDTEALKRFADGMDVITYEFENVPYETAATLEAICPVYPHFEALKTAQDRVMEKTLFNELGIATPAFQAVDTAEELAQAIETIGIPFVLKTRRLGYDGKGQAVVEYPEEAASAFRLLGGKGLIAEQLVQFEREVSIIAARAINGEIACYPLTENVHRDGILRTSVAPADASDKLRQTAESYVTNLMNHFGYVGVLALELFDCGDRLLANEMACRVHNSGHWTIDGAVTSQFENHLRAITGLSLGSVETTGFSVMHNLIGTLPELSAVAVIPNVHIHLYGKEARPGRKIGHLTATASDLPTLQAKYSQIRILE